MTVVRLGRIFKSTTVRLAGIVWIFGYMLVEVAAVADGRSKPGQMLLANAPLLLLGVLQSVALARLMNRLGAQPPLIRWPIVAIAGFAAGLLQTAADDIWLRAVALTVLPEWRDWAAPFQPQRLFIVALLYIWTMYLNIALAWATWTSDQAQLNEARAAAFEAAASRAETAALRLQLNPHFLFNTLNGIASLVVRNRQTDAEDMIGRLADFLRASLAADPTALVSLSRELETISAYLSIERARLGDRLQVEIEAPPHLTDTQVPNFILQPLVENAIKHGAARSRWPTTISIQARKVGDAVALIVTNYTGERRGEAMSELAPAQDDRIGIGLINTRKRLEAQYGGAAWLQTRAAPGAYQVELVLPLGPM